MLESPQDTTLSCERRTIDFLVKKLSEFLKILNIYGMHHEIVNQIFKQVIILKPIFFFVIQIKINVKTLKRYSILLLPKRLTA